MTDFTHLVDLAAEALGGRAVGANDEFFAPKENLLKASKPVFVEGKFTARGKWMDGWETRRRRTPGHDWCIVRLGLPGTIRGVVVDTSFFKGNYPERCSIEACDLGAAPYEDEKQALLGDKIKWVELLPELPLEGDSQNQFAIERPGRFTHLRLNIFPDGGVARLRVHGEVAPCAGRSPSAEFDLAAVENGGSIISSSDQFFGEPLNMLMPGLAHNMGEGWETRRRRGPGHDWAIVKLAIPGSIRRVEVSTAHFKGNFPESCAIEACFAGSAANPLLAALTEWKPVLPKTLLKANARHVFRGQLQSVGLVTHVRLNIYPDGGISRFRVFGVAAEPHASARPAQASTTGAPSSAIARFNELAPAQASKALLDCCGSRAWVAAILARRPYHSDNDFFVAADAIWSGLSRRDWLEAFRHHPPIGAGKAAAQQSTEARKWSAGEQSVAQQASANALAEIAEANFEYQSKFGYVFLICATGKSADQILAALRKRMANNSKTEIQIAAEEQRKITRLRLEKLLKALGAA
ncbi:MAG TPA: allantoicase [Candidatus Acidoferrales bacterium]|jgi:allantoicase|nr:allantoicase [Candidatus Acidoferrales bacterium]